MVSTLPNTRDARHAKRAGNVPAVDALPRRRQAPTVRRCAHVSRQAGHRKTNNRVQERCKVSSLKEEYGSEERATGRDPQERPTVPR